MDLYTCICKDIDQMHKQLEREGATALKKIAAEAKHLLERQSEL